MCRRVKCSKCGKPTYAGCGAHIEQVLADVPKAERCQCPHTKAQRSAGLARMAMTALAGLAAAYFLLWPKGDVSGEEARRLVEGGALLLDVRTQEEFAAGHLPNALNIPVQELDRRLADVGPKGRGIVLYCRSGNRSGEAARMLKEAGYSAVHDLGAMSSW